MRLNIHPTDMQVNNFHIQIPNRINQAHIYYLNKKKTPSRLK